MKTSKAVINKWVEKANLTNHTVEFAFDTDSAISKYGLVNFILSLRNEVERWDLLTTHILINSTLKQYVIGAIGNDVVKEQGKYFIWGMELFFTPHINPEFVLAMDNDNHFGDARHIVIGKIDTVNLQRLIKLKAFW